MIISKIYSKLNKEEKEGLAWGLVWGLAWGLVVGLAWGLAWGLVWGLAWGLVWGLVWGLACGLVAGLVWGLAWGLVVILTNFTEALPFINGLLPILILIGIIFILVEVFFWLSPREKVKKKDRLKHTLKRKGEALLEVLLGLSLIAQIYIFIREVDFIKYFPEILKWIGYLGLALICFILVVGIVYLWIKLNSLKYSKKGVEE